jgi:hypothetical protein
VDKTTFNPNKGRTLKTFEGSGVRCLVLKFKIVQVDRGEFLLEERKVQFAYVTTLKKTRSEII